MQVRFGRRFGERPTARRVSGRARVVAAVVAAVLLLESGAVLLVPLMRTQAAETTRVGVFAALYVHNEDGTAPVGGGTRYTLLEDSGAITELRLSQSLFAAAGGLAAVDRRRVVVIAEQATGPQSLTPEQPLFVRSLTPERGPAVVPQQVTGSRAFLNVLCKFAGSTNEPQPQSYFDSLMSAANPLGIDTYWREVSYSTINLAGSVSLGWGTMARTKAHYDSTYWNVGNNYNGLRAIANDCMQSVASAVNPNNFQGINLIFNDRVGGSAWGGAIDFTLNSTSYVLPMTWMPPWGYTGTSSNNGISVLSHEMGHAFGFGHSASPSGATYQNAWDVMSGATTNCAAATLAPYGCLGQHIIGRHRDQAGWLPSNRRFVYDANANLTRAFTLDAITTGTGGNYLLGIVPRVGNAGWFTTVELRRRVNRDVRLYGDAVIVHDVQTGRLDDAWVQGTDGNAGAMFTEGETYAIPGTLLTLSVRSFSPTSARIVISNGLPPIAASLSTTLSNWAGTPVTITGTNLSPEASVTFGGVSAQSVVANPNGTLTAVAPALPDGTHAVAVTNPDGLSGGIGGFQVLNIRVAPNPRGATGPVGVPNPGQPGRPVAPEPAVVPLPAPPRR